MVRVVHFDSPPMPEGAFARVREEVQAIRSRPELRDASHEALVKESIKSIAEKVPADSPPTPSPAPSASSASSRLPAYADDADASVKTEVEALLRRVAEKGLLDAIAAAKKAEPFVEDAFHDALVEKMMPAFREESGV